MRYLLKGGTVVSGTGLEVADVLIDGEKIAKVTKNIATDEVNDCDLNVIEAEGKLIFPGFIDAHTHFDLEVAGTVTADNFESGTKAAIIGGTTCIIDFATQDKGSSLNEALKKWHSKADGNSSCDYGFHMAITDWNERTKNELQDIMKQGVTSFKVYMTYDTKVNDSELFEILTSLKAIDGIVGVHCENSDIIAELQAKQKQQGNYTPSAHPLSRPDEVEAEAIYRLLTIARIVDIPVIIVHLTSKKGYEQVEKAREDGQTIFLETCPQYLLLDDSLYSLPEFESAKYVISPPLRKKSDQESLWNAIFDENIQTLATDHCSFRLAQKDMGRDDFTKIPNGMPGVETRAKLVYTYGVLDGRITEKQMCKLMAENPAKLYGMYPRKGIIQAGSDADIVIWDPLCEGVIEAKTQLQNVDYAPFEGWKYKGAPQKVFLRGSLVVDDGKLVKEHQGTYLIRNKRLVW